MSWELVAELLAAASGVLLVRPALRVNGVMRDSAALRAILKTSTAAVDRATIPTVVAELDQQTARWDQWDDRCLKLGVFLFTVSSLIKVVLVWLKP